MTSTTYAVALAGIATLLGACALPPAPSQAITVRTTPAAGAAEQPLIAEGGPDRTPAPVAVVEADNVPVAPTPSAVVPSAPALSRPALDPAALAAARGFGVADPRSTVMGSERALTETGDTNLSAADVRAAAAALAPSFRACYTRALVSDADARGRVRVTLKIGANGEVGSASLSGGEGLPPVALSCIQSVATSARFDPPGGAGCTVVIPLTFAPGE
ncbi:MAG: AgmX/PglI C-terminal domain-containing protein [Polyangiaceae bacterium]